MPEITPFEVIVNFHCYINDRKYDEAFNLLTPAFQQRIWQSDSTWFAQGYASIVAQSNIRIEPFHIENERAQFDINFDETVRRMQHPLINDLVDLPEEKRDNVETQNAIAAFKEYMITELNADPIETVDIRDQRFFEPNNVQTCLWLGKADYMLKTELFLDDEETYPVYRHGICEKNEHNIWLIEGFKRERPAT